MTNFTENELIPYALKIIKEHKDGIDTTNLIAKLRQIMKPDGDDAEILSNRSDDKFSQKVRNLKSHKNLEKKKLVDYKNNNFFIRQEGLNFLEDLKDDFNIKKDEIIKVEKDLESKIDKKLMSINILNDWPISARTYNALRNENIIFLGDLLLFDENSLLKLRNFGRKSLKELDDLFEKFKISRHGIFLDISQWDELRRELIIEHKENENKKIESKKHLAGINKSIFKDFNQFREDFYNQEKKIISFDIKNTDLEKLIIEDIEYILSLLSDRMVDFFKGRYGYEENYKTLEQLGQKYGITRERVRQLENNLNLSLIKLGTIDKDSLLKFFSKYEFISFHKLFPLLDKKFTDTARSTEEISQDKLSSFIENYCGVKNKFFKTPERELWDFDILKLEEIFKIIPSGINKENFLEIIQDNYGYNKFVSSSALEFMLKKKLIEVHKEKIYAVKLSRIQEVSHILLNFPEGLHWKKIAEIGNNSFSNNKWDLDRPVADYSMGMQSNSDIYLSDRGTIKLFKFCSNISDKEKIIDFFINFLLKNNKNESSMETAFKEIIKIDKFKNLNFYDARAIIKKFGGEKGIYHSGPSGTNTISFDKNVKRISLKDKIKEIIDNEGKEIHHSIIKEKLQKTNEDLPLEVHLNDLVDKMFIFRISPGTYLNFNEAINLCDKNEVYSFLNKILDNYQFITMGFMREQINEHLGYNLSNFYYDSLSRILANENAWHYGSNYLSKKYKKEISVDKYIKDNFDESLSNNENYDILSKKIGISKIYFSNIVYQSKNKFNTDWVHQIDE